MYARHLVAALLAASLLAFLGCVEPEPADTSSPKAFASSVLGPRPSASDRSGVTKHTIRKRTIHVTYQVWPTGFINKENEIGHHIAPIFRRLMHEASFFDSVEFQLRHPTDDGMGNLTYHDSVRFVTTRELHDKINWERFLPEGLLKVAEGVVWTWDQR